MPDTVVPPSIPTAPVTSAILDGLRAIVGDRGLILDDQGKEPFVRDWRGSLVGNAAVVVRPGTTEEVSRVVKLCFDNGIAIVPQGGNTGLMGGATPWPAHNGILLSLGRMNKVIEVDAVGYSMTVEAGCVLQTLQETAASHDRGVFSQRVPRTLRGAGDDEADSAPVFFWLLDARQTVTAHSPGAPALPARPLGGRGR